jgi:hypothetical protein
MTIHPRAICTSLRSGASWGAHKEGVTLCPESVQRGHVRLAVTQQARDVSEKLVAACARHHDVLQPSLTRPDVAEGMGMAGRDDRHRSQLGGKELVTNLDLIRLLQKAKISDSPGLCGQLLTYCYCCHGLLTNGLAGHQRGPEHQASSCSCQSRLFWLSLHPMACVFGLFVVPPPLSIVGRDTSHKPSRRLGASSTVGSREYWAWAHAALARLRQAA